jgi:regulator of PEP synthase PpsR (kinase-PPPase family)
VTNAGCCQKFSHKPARDSKLPVTLEKDRSTTEPTRFSTKHKQAIQIVMPNTAKQYFHMHLVSDATGETLNTVARAATAYYAGYQPIEHIYTLVRTSKQLDRVIIEVEKQPGIVLFTIADDDLKHEIERRCDALGTPCISILDPVIASLATYLNTKSKPQIGGQHVLNAEYFRRIDALNFTMAHDDGQMTEDLDTADVILLGISRSSKTPTSIYLANRGIKTANIPLVPGVAPPAALMTLTNPLVVGLVASAERIAQIRRHRLLTLNEGRETSYADRKAITEELLAMRKLCASKNWPVIDVTRRSIEETAAAVMNLLSKRPGRKAATS